MLCECDRRPVTRDELYPSSQGRARAPCAEQLQRRRTLAWFDRPCSSRWDAGVPRGSRWCVDATRACCDQCSLWPWRLVPGAATCSRSRQIDTTETARGDAAGRDSWGACAWGRVRQVRSPSRVTGRAGDAGSVARPTQPVRTRPVDSVEVVGLGRDRVQASRDRHLADPPIDSPAGLPLEPLESRSPGQRNGRFAAPLRRAGRATACGPSDEMRSMD
jgi:hypothetical protein